jgi:hypothetical protein
MPGVLRIALLGSLATDKPLPKDADVLVTIWYSARMGGGPDMICSPRSLPLVTLAV